MAHAAMTTSMAEAQSASATQGTESLEHLRLQYYSEREEQFRSHSLVAPLVFSGLSAGVLAGSFLLFMSTHLGGPCSGPCPDTTQRDRVAAAGAIVGAAVLAASLSWLFVRVAHRRRIKNTLLQRYGLALLGQGLRF